MTSIRQKPSNPVGRGSTMKPPDFRNLGVILRCLLGANLLALITVVLRNANLAQLGQEYLEMAGLVELPLMLGLTLCYVFAQTIQKLRYGWATLVVCVLAAIGVMVCLPGLIAISIRPRPQAWVFWSMGAAAVQMAYFHWRAALATPAIAEARVLALNARIRPHFFFNSLNGVLGVIRSDPRRAEAALESLADLFRELMQENRELVTLTNEIEIANRYLDLERLRLGDRLKVEWDLRNCPLNARVPPLMLQPLLENAVYHGIEPSTSPGHILIRITQRGRELHIWIINPLCEGARHQQGNRMAMNNIRERLALFFDLEAHLQAGAHDGHYEVHVRLPVLKEKT